MNVAALRAILEGLPDTMPVFVSGYEGGVQDPNTVLVEKVLLNVNRVDWLGPHELIRGGEHTPGEVVDALVITRSFL